MRTIRANTFCEKKTCFKQIALKGMLLNELYVNFNELMNLSKKFFVNSCEVILPDVLWLVLLCKTHV